MPKTSKGELSGELLAKLQAEKPPQVVKLIQQAWDAHEKEDWAVAKPLWALLSLIESQDANVWFNLAYAEVHSGEDWQLICDAYQRAHLLEPSAIVCNNWGNALLNWARTLTGEVQQQRFAEADQRFAEATRIQPNFALAYKNWGVVLNNWATTLMGEVKQQRFAEADRRFVDATRLQPIYPDAYINWGIALKDWAKSLAGESQQHRFTEADLRFAEATRLNPGNADAYNNRGTVLLYWTHTLQGDERAAKLDEAERVLLLAKDKGAETRYNLACLRAVQQRPDDARALLEQTRAAGLLPDFAHLSTDRDLENLRGLDWFQALLEEVKQQEAASQAAG